MTPSQPVLQKHTHTTMSFLLGLIPPTAEWEEGDIWRMTSPKMIAVSIIYLLEAPHFSILGMVCL